MTVTGPAVGRPGGRTGYGPNVRLRARKFLKSTRGAVLAAGFLTFCLSMSRGTAEGFVYDAAGYWNGTEALLQGADYYEAGLLAIRGAFSVFIYMPAVFMTLLIGTGGELLVLLQNSVLIALIAVRIVPGLAGFFSPVSARHIWISALACAVLLRGFSPYPLLDLWALGALLMGVLLVLRSDRWGLILGGLVLGISVNLRPAYLAPVVLVLLVRAAYCRGGRWLWPFAGAILSLVPQVILNVVQRETWRPWPVDMSRISGIQAQYSSFVVRYDTVAFNEARDPRQFFCGTEAAESVAGNLPQSTGDVIASILANLPGSLWFVAQKVAASLHWSWSTPYADDPGSGFSFLTIVVIAVSSIGFVAIVRFLLAHRCTPKSAMASVLGVAWFGAIGTLALSAPETRFALPIVIIGVVGCLPCLPSSLEIRLPTMPSLLWGLGAVAVAFSLLFLGFAGLAHPAAAGDVTATTCQTVD